MTWNDGEGHGGLLTRGCSAEVVDPQNILTCADGESVMRLWVMQGQYDST